MNDESSQRRPVTIKLTVQVWEDDTPGFHDYGLRRSDWRRACRMIERHGFDGSLRAMDGRAWAAAEAGRLGMCVRWRDIMAAVHAIGSDSPLPCDRVH